MPVVVPWRKSTVYGERGALRLGVVLDHQREVELVEPLARERRADDAGRVAHEERDLLGRGELGRHDEVALVLAVLVVDDDDDLAAADGGDRVLDGGERARFGRVIGSVLGAVRAAGRVGIEQALDVLGDHVDLEVDRVARALVPERRDLGGVRDHGDGEPVVERARRR